MVRDDPSSILHLYRRLLAVRRSSPALRCGDQTMLPPGTPDDVLAWERHDPATGDRRVVAVNYAAAARPFDPPSSDAAGTWQVELASDGGGEAAPYTGSLAPHQAVILRP